MTKEKSPIENMLNLALATSLNHYKFYLDAAEKTDFPKVKALLMVLAESEEELAKEIEEMMFRGVVRAIETTRSVSIDESPDETPFDLTREETDPRIFVCNEALKQEIKGYTFFLSIATRAESEIISRLFQYFADIKARQIRRIRRVCSTF